MISHSIEPKRFTPEYLDSTNWQSIRFWTIANQALAKYSAKNNIESGRMHLIITNFVEFMGGEIKTDENGVKRFFLNHIEDFVAFFELSKKENKANYRRNKGNFKNWRTK